MSILLHIVYVQIVWLKTLCFANILDFTTVSMENIFKFVWHLNKFAVACLMDFVHQPLLIQITWYSQRVTTKRRTWNAYYKFSVHQLWTLHGANRIFHPFWSTLEIEFISVRSSFLVALAIKLKSTTIFKCSNVNSNMLIGLFPINVADMLSCAIYYLITVTFFCLFHS